MNKPEYHILSKPGCPACIEAKAALTVRGLDYSEVNHTTQADLDRFVAAGHRTFPRIYRNGELIGGNRELQALLNPPKADDNDF